MDGLIETDAVKKGQAAKEAVMLLDEAGFEVEGFTIDSNAGESVFTLSASLAVSEHVRPLEALE